MASPAPYRAASGIMSEREFQAAASERYVAMNRRTFASVSGHTRRPFSRFLTNDLSLTAFSPNCQMDSP